MHDRNRQKSLQREAAVMLPPLHRRSQELPVEPKRWAVLGVYNMIGFSQSMVWVTYSASAPEARALYGEDAMDKASINLLLNWGPIMYVIAAVCFVCTCR